MEESAASLPPRYGLFHQFIRIMTFANYFLGSCITLGLAQYAGWPLYAINRRWYCEYMAFTKHCFAIIMITMTYIWSPTMVRLSSDESVSDQIGLDKDGNLSCNFPGRMVVIGNHQIYTDWIYLWFVAYAARVQGYVYIILKESLKWIPLLGPGMQFFQFVFMSRNLATDRPRLIHRLQKLAKPYGPLIKTTEDLDPMWLLLFPEGTNFCPNGKKASDGWAKKQGIEPLRNCLLPRSTGTLLCLQQLAETVEWVYDCTIYYEGVPRDHFGQDYFTLRSSFFAGKPPRSVNMYWQRFRIRELPLSDAHAFDRWLTRRWRDKENLINYFHIHGRFPPSSSVSTASDGVLYFESQIKLYNWMQVGQVYLLTILLALVAWIGVGVYNYVISV